MSPDGGDTRHLGSGLVERVTPRPLRADVPWPVAVHDRLETITATPAPALLVFAGPPGTGKTLAAEVIAARLGVALYRIDLRRVVSQFIGETERNLDRVFGDVAGVRAVLFFDEADALFGRRTEVGDAHDRFANQEVAYLLQRIEAFGGLAILATNRRGAIPAPVAAQAAVIVDFSPRGPDPKGP